MNLVLQNKIYATARFSDFDTGGWQTVTGGEVTNDAQKDRPPGAVFPTSIPGPADITNITLGRTFDTDRDTDALRARLRDAARRGKPATIGVPVIDADGNVKGRETFTGIIVRYKPPEGDSNGSDKATVELEFQISGVS